MNAPARSLLGLTQAASLKQETRLGGFNRRPLFTLGNTIIEANLDVPGMEQSLIAILQDQKKRVEVLYPQEFEAWIILFLILSEIDDRIKVDGPLTKLELTRSAWFIKSKNPKAMVDSLVELKFLISEKSSKIEEGYKVNMNLVLQKLKFFKSQYQDLRMLNGRSIVEMMTSLPSPNDPCICGSGKKFKKCHKYLYD